VTQRGTPLITQDRQHKLCTWVKKAENTHRTIRRTTQEVLHKRQHVAHQSTGTRDENNTTKKQREHERDPTEFGEETQRDLDFIHCVRPNSEIGVRFSGSTFQWHTHEQIEHIAGYTANHTVVCVCMCVHVRVGYVCVCVCTCESMRARQRVSGCVCACVCINSRECVR
jgi:hypothetical protein